MNRKEWRWVALVTLALVAASSLPYLVAWAATPEGARFTGLLVNPLDGHSYIAKMRQGLDGSWRFRLAFTPESQDGKPVYLFFLLLGHVARWIDLPLILVYHAARTLGGVAMLLALYALISQLGKDVGERRTMFLLTALGSGVGWLAGSLGVMTADLWVIEAFPVYALLANAHFPLAMGLMMGIAACGLQIAACRARMTECRWQMMGGTAGAVTLGVIQPFGLVAVLGGLGVMLVARMVRKRAILWRAWAWAIGTGALALFYPGYMQWAMRSDPVLAAWNAQNVTFSPPLWDWALSYGLVLVLAVLGSVVAARRRLDGDWLLLGWVAVTLVGVYLPLSLQRRLSLGLGAPMGLLAGMGWWRIVRPRVRVGGRWRMQVLVTAFCTLTTVFLISMMLLAALAGEPRFYLSEGEWQALAWLREEASHDQVVLCAPQTGMFVPAWAGQRVVYGHPFETVDAERREAQVEAYWAGEMDTAEQEPFLRDNGVGYVLVGPREHALCGGAEAQECKGAGKLVFEADDVKVYEVTW
ncbi:MAG: hypothetical protein DRI81_19290 [Chloroflexi bacterium]|nr:MAG: hypothetical protein DRI81_19290 [Chloroflexota bacterium]HEY74345.1 hypothetical protein [Thermoflexia bacterium]